MTTQQSRALMHRLLDIATSVPGVEGAAAASVPFYDHEATRLSVPGLPLFARPGWIPIWCYARSDLLSIEPRCHGLPILPPRFWDQAAFHWTDDRADDSISESMAVESRQG
ncbi:MAG: hypothetical protein ABI442_19565, partial [Gemmatimonadaceae bacterium]